MKVGKVSRAEHTVLGGANTSSGKANLGIPIVQRPMWYEVLTRVACSNWYDAFVD